MLQSEAQRILNGLLDNAVNRSQPGQHILLCGKRGLVDKTVFAVIPQIKGLIFRHPSISTLERAGDLAAVLTHLPANGFLFIAEINRLPQPVYELLRQAMDSFVLRIEVGKGSTLKVVDLALPPFTMIGGTSAPYLLPDSLKKLFQHQLWIEEDTAPFVQEQ